MRLPKSDGSQFVSSLALYHSILIILFEKFFSQKSVIQFLKIVTSSWPTLSSLSLSLFLPTSLSFFLSFSLSLSLSLSHTHTHREIYNKTVNVLSLSHWLTQGEDLTHCQDSLSQTNSHKQKSKANFYTLVKDTLSLSFSIYFVSLSV